MQVHWRPNAVHANTCRVQRMYCGRWCSQGRRGVHSGQSFILEKGEHHTKIKLLQEQVLPFLWKGLYKIWILQRGPLSSFSSSIAALHSMPPPSSPHSQTKKADRLDARHPRYEIISHYFPIFPQNLSISLHDRALWRRRTHKQTKTDGLFVWLMVDA
jgi:hypothetical protein